MQGFTVLYAGTGSIEAAVRARWPYASESFRRKIVDSRLRRVKKLATEIAALSTPQCKRV